MSKNWVIFSGADPQIAFMPATTIMRAAMARIAAKAQVVTPLANATRNWLSNSGFSSLGITFSSHVSRDPGRDRGLRVHRAKEFVRTTGPPRPAVPRCEIVTKDVCPRDLMFLK